MENGRILFICATPYHIYNSINLKLSKYTDYNMVDILIIEDFFSSKQYIQILKSCNIFENVYNVTRPIIDTRLKRWRMRYTLLMDDVKFFYKDELPNYDLIYTSLLDIISISMFLNQRKKNKKIKFSVIEDGMAAYMTTDQLNVTSLIYKVRGIRINKDINEMYMWQPQLTIYKDAYNMLKELPRPNVHTLNMLEEIFKVSDSEKKEISSYPIIYLDQPLEETNWGVTRKDILQIILKYSEIDKLVVKRHPRKQNFHYEEYGVNILEEIKSPWEVLVANIKGNILITFNSSAALTPNFIYNNNNKVIFLYKYFMKDTPLCSEWDRFFYKVKETYPEYVFIPETEKDLVEVFNKAKEWIEVKDEYSNYVKS